jgi:DNA-binding transcriptional LysR family regulator
MELRQLRYFVALAETGNFHRAAERLNMSQPPLTVAIRKLEASLGTPLFDRGPRGVTLTAAGAAALDTARAALAQAEQFHRTVREGGMGERGRLRVGFVGSSVFELLPRIIPSFRRRYPLVELVLEEATSVGIVRALQEGTMDVGLVRLPLLETAAVETRVVEQDELHAAIPANNHLASRDKIALQALENEPFVLQSRVSVLHARTLMACHDAGFAPRVAQEAAQFSAVLSLVQSGLGVALVPSRAVRSVPQGVRLVRLANRVPIDIGVALSQGIVSLSARNFANMIDIAKLS